MTALEKIIAMNTKILTELKEEREKSNKLVEQLDYLGAVLMAVLKKHKYSSISVPAATCRELLLTHEVGFSGDEEQNVIVSIETKAQKYSDFVEEKKQS